MLVRQNNGSEAQNDRKSNPLYPYPTELALTCGKIANARRGELSSSKARSYTAAWGWRCVLYQVCLAAGFLGLGRGAGVLFVASLDSDIAFAYDA